VRTEIIALHGLSFYSFANSIFDGMFMVFCLMCIYYLNKTMKYVIRDSQQSNLRALASIRVSDMAISVIHRDRQVFREVLRWFLVSIYFF